MFSGMPQLEYEEKKPVSVISGPFLSELSGTTATVCFTTNQKVSAGLSVFGNDKKQLIRFGKETIQHSIKIKGLQPGNAYNCKVLIQNKSEDEFSFKTYKYDDNVKIAFILDGKNEKARLESTINILNRRNIHNIVLLGSQVKNSGEINSWIQNLFSPNQNKLLGKTIIHSPESFKIPNGLFLDKSTKGSYSVDYGSVYLIMISEYDMKPKNFFRLEPWVNNELRKAGNKWKIVLLPNDIISSGKNGINVRMLKKWAPMFEQHEVDFVLTKTSRYYHRSLPIGTNHRGIQYITLPSLTPEKAPGSPSDFTAKQSDAPGVFIINTTLLNRIEGRVIGVDNFVKDYFAMNYKTKTENAFIINREKMTTEAWAKYSQQKELKTIIRQLYKAVNNPARPKALRIDVNNPSPLPFKGELAWDTFDSVFYITPQKITFNLQSGQGISSIFKLQQNKADGKMPLLTAKTDSGLKESGRLLLTWQQKISIKRTSEKYSIDGKPNEEFWKRATAITDFTTIDGKKLAHRPPLAWIIAGTEGLRIRFRCPINQSNPTFKATEHDDNVWQDDSIEVFLDPDAEGRKWYQFSLSANNIALDSNSLQGRRWNPEWTHKVSIKKNRYNAEILIPYKALGIFKPPTKGTKWGINFTRNFYKNGYCEIAQAATTHGANSRSGCYIIMSFE